MSIRQSVEVGQPHPFGSLVVERTPISSLTDRKTSSPRRHLRGQAGDDRVAVMPSRGRDGRDHATVSADYPIPSPLQEWR
jgi:hypothetical protein